VLSIAQNIKLVVSNDRKFCEWRTGDDVVGRGRGFNSEEYAKEGS
jgi:hypothetical protein